MSVPGKRIIAGVSSSVVCSSVSVTRASTPRLSPVANSHLRPLPTFSVLPMHHSLPQPIPSALLTKFRDNLRKSVLHRVQPEQRSSRAPGLPLSSQIVDNTDDDMCSSSSSPSLAVALFSSAEPAPASLCSPLFCTQRDHYPSRTCSTLLHRKPLSLHFLRRSER